MLAQQDGNVDREFQFQPDWSQPCWFNVGLMERPTVGSTSVNHQLLMQTFDQPSMSVVTPRVQPKDGWANGNGWALLAGPLSNRSPTPPLGLSCANGQLPPTLVLPAPITRSDPV
ncbi:hypothetical protein PGTUg99_013621 [Puccinia graminis f. sp. tritici]|uniref:Uncharacterized protein n=1 Tax=Puccinia graminis f. sp. tritici TaxID=56615 RepID=A0A5B0M3K2_PUCGR|nr:hypothetical protein PGTUg99_013621 [Puccinia graminis f. sp. tritici]